MISSLIITAVFSGGKHTNVLCTWSFNSVSKVALSEENGLYYDQITDFEMFFDLK